MITPGMVVLCDGEGSDLFLVDRVWEDVNSASLFNLETLTFHGIESCGKLHPTKQSARQILFAKKSEIEDMLAVINNYLSENS